MAARGGITISQPNAVFVYDKKALRKMMRQVGNEIAARARSLIKTASKGGRGRVRSQPGSAPASLTGQLLRSVKVFPFKSGEGVAVRDTMFYALMLENGAQGGVSAHGLRNVYKRVDRKRVRTTTVGRRVLLPRPFLSLAFAAKEASLAQRVQAAVVEGVAFKRQR